MTRRDLLKYLLTTPLAATVDYEKLLWIPEKTIFIPSPQQIYFMENDDMSFIFGGGRGGGKSLYNNLQWEVARFNLIRREMTLRTK